MSSKAFKSSSSSSAPAAATVTKYRPGPLSSKVPKMKPDVAKYDSTTDDSSGSSSSGGESMSSRTLGLDFALEEAEFCQSEISDLNESEIVEMQEVAKKYCNLKKFQFNERNKSIAKIPNFWFRTMLKHPQMAEVIAETEEDCLCYLTGVKVELFEEAWSGYKIKFGFRLNPYFENLVIVKESHIGAKSYMSTSTKINWRRGMDLVKQNSPKAPVGAALFGLRSKSRVGYRSFFSWFIDNSDPNHDYIGEVIKNELWANPLKYFYKPHKVVTVEDMIVDKLIEDNNNVVAENQSQVSTEVSTDVDMDIDDYCEVAFDEEEEEVVEDGVVDEEGDVEEKDEEEEFFFDEMEKFLEEEWGFDYQN